LPKSLGEAVTALRADDTFRASFGSAFIDYFTHIKDAEFTRYQKDADEAGDPAVVTAWEQKEYLDLF
jgi:glutamine synthetase